MYVSAKVTQAQQGSFLHENAHKDLINGTRPVTGTVVHSHRNQILRYKSFPEIQMVAGTLKEKKNLRFTKLVKI